MPLDIEKSPTEKLQARFKELGEQLSEISVERAAIHEELARREKTARIKNRVSRMSKEEQDDLSMALRSK
jgi:predicted nuclease with TOPRIM domain